MTIKRLPDNWQAQLEQRAEPAEPAAPAKAGPLHYGFLAALGLAVVGACVGEMAGCMRGRVMQHCTVLRQYGFMQLSRACRLPAAFILGHLRLAFSLPPHARPCSAGRHGGCATVLLGQWLRHLR